MDKKKLLKYSIVLGVIKKVAIVLFIAYSSSANAQISEVDTSNENEKQKYFEWYVANIQKL